MELCVSADRRCVRRVWAEQPHATHPDRFLQCPQVLGREGLLGSAYWEVTCQRGVDMGVAYSNICRNGEITCCLIGQNPVSWSLECSDWGFVASHAGHRVGVGLGLSDYTPCRVGVFLDWPEGELSFYFLSADCRTHLHTFFCNFSQPLYPAFWLWGTQASLALIPITHY